jgi:hypothetical protein
LTQLTTAARREAAVLHAEWERAFQMLRDTYGAGEARAEAHEDECFERLVHFCDANDLTNSEYDPRDYDYEADEAEARAARED